jgi:hypothetical protein
MSCRLSSLSRVVDILVPGTRVVSMNNGIWTRRICIDGIELTRALRLVTRSKIDRFENNDGRGYL